MDQGWGSGKGSKGRREWEEKAKEREGREIREETRTKAIFIRSVL